MGFSADHLVSFKGNLKEGEELRKILEFQARRRWQERKQWLGRKNGGRPMRNNRSKRVFMMNRARVGGSRRDMNGINRRVRTLKKLIPNTESMGMGGLFRETADYILSLQMRVKVMQIMVKVLTGSDEGITNPTSV